jgi:hypothetical protein
VHPGAKPPRRGETLKVSDLIAELQALMAAHGDLPVYSIADHEFVTGAFCDEVADWRGESGQAIVLE